MSHPKTPHIVDARQMEPPEPFERTMEMLDTLAPGDSMVLLLYREPHPLFRVLQRNGHRYAVEQQADGTYEIQIWQA